mgnify:CR=1 FL=1
MASAPTDLPSYEQAGELKFGQVGIANLRVRTLDVAQLAAEMRERVERAPKLFARAAVILDFGGLASLPDDATAKALLKALGKAGVHPVALAYGTLLVFGGHWAAQRLRAHRSAGRWLSRAAGVALIGFGARLATE